MLNKTIEFALENPIKKKGRRSISRMASILTDGKNTYYGWNRWKTHPLQKKFQSNSEALYLHCEIDALRNAVREGVKDFSNYTLYCARVLYDGTPALAKPCPGCQRALIHFGIKDCIFTE